MDKQQALNTLNQYLSEHGGNENSTLDDWSISDFKNALLFSVPAPSRSNYLYLVKDGNVVGFSPSTMSLDDAYASL